MEEYRHRDERRIFLKQSVFGAVATAVPGNRMPFSGVTDETELAALVEYLSKVPK